MKILLLISLFIIGAWPARADAQDSVQWRSTPMRLPAELQDSLRFGYLSVPRDHAQPNGPQFKIAIAIVKARTPKPQPDPVVFIPGGPGLSGLDTYLRGRLNGEHPFDAFRATRDLIVIDPRGFGYSEPRMCPHVEDGDPTIPAGTPEAEWLTALTECRAGMQQHGIDLATLSSAHAARDLDVLRRAIGVEQLNLFGLSYGSRIALEATHQIPSVLRSVYLFGPMPRAKSRGADDSALLNESREAMFVACAAQPACRAAYPALRQDYDAALARVRSTPFRAGEDLLVDDAVLARSLINMLASRRLGEGVPLLIHTIAREGTGILEDLGPNLAAAYRAGRGVPGTGQAYWCNDGVIDETSSPAMQERCKRMIGKVNAAPSDSAVTGTVPILIGAGELDPLTPPSFAQFLTRGSTTARVVTVPVWGHELPPACSFGIAARFVDAPAKEPDTACLANAEKMEFVAGVDARDWLSDVDRQPTNWARFAQRLALGFAATVFVVSVTLLWRRRRQRGTA